MLFIFHVYVLNGMMMVMDAAHVNHSSDTMYCHGMLLHCCKNVFLCFFWVVLVKTNNPAAATQQDAP